VSGINDLSIERFIADQTQPIMLVFSASFCGPSAMLEPLLDQLSEDFADRLVVADIDVEKCPNITRQYQIKGTPAMVVLKQGEPVASRMGTSSYEELAAWTAKVIA